MYIIGMPLLLTVSTWFATYDIRLIYTILWKACTYSVETMTTFDSKHLKYGDTDVLSAFERATNVYRFCPNRVWTSARTLLGKRQNLPFLFPPRDKKVARVFSLLKESGDYDLGKHKDCTDGKCEISQSDFTSVSQRHECDRDECLNIPDRYRFTKSMLDSSAQQGGTTAWHLNGQALVSGKMRFMALSHVWSDGTGTGGREKSQVNDCLYGFFASIARQFGCQGIWWDTICMPKDKTARAIAISTMHKNYEDAEFTLVHDCFLRNLEWTDAETACLAIVMSPWFSRGWTALELAKSRIVKVVFKQGDALVVKDLDQDLLRSQDPPTERHQLLIAAIKQLRSTRITDLGPLLSVLGSRYTSWSRDMAIIAGLLVGVSVEPALGSSTSTMPQQDIYKNILQVIRTLKHGHLFHNATTMFQGLSWCPANIFEMPAVATSNDSKGFLEIRSNGDLLGKWNTIKIESVAPESHLWSDENTSLIESKLRLALKQTQDHRFLVEPGVTTFTRALVVRNHTPSVRNRPWVVQFIGSMKFHSPQTIDPVSREELVRIMHSATGVKFKAGARNDALASSSATGRGKQETHPLENRTRNRVSPLHEVSIIDNNEYDPNSYITGEMRRFRNDQFLEEICDSLESGQVLDERDLGGRSLLSQAAERGDLFAVNMILNYLEQPLSATRHTAGVKVRIPSEQLWKFLQSRDNNRMTALSWAAGLGHSAIVEKLILWHNVDIDSTSHPQDYSVWKRHPIRDRIEKPEPDVHDVYTPLSLAARLGHVEIVEMLLRAGANPDGPPYTVYPLCQAARYGHVDCIKLLLKANAECHGPEAHKGCIESTSSWLKFYLEDVYKCGLRGSALELAVKNGHEDAASLLLDKIEDKEDFELATYILISGGYPRLVEQLFKKLGDDEPWFCDALEKAASEGQSKIAKMLLRKKVDIDSKAYIVAASNHECGLREVGQCTKEGGLESNQCGYYETVKLLLQGGANVNKLKSPTDRSALQLAVKAKNIAIAELLLDHKADVKLGVGRYDGTPLQTAKSHKDKAMIKLLREHGAGMFGW